MKFIVVSLFALALLSTAPASQAAPPLPSGPPSTTKIEGYCNEHGGTFMPIGEGADTYGCILPDGTIIVCGGSISGCSTIEASAGLPPTRLPRSIVGLKLQIDSKAEQQLLNDKMDLLQLTVEELAEDVCVEPDFL